MSMMQLLLMVVEAIVMLFELRSLMQSSSADYYNPLVLAVARLTDAPLRMTKLKSLKIGHFYIGGFVLALGISLVFWTALSFYFQGSFGLIAPAALIMTVKSFGYLLLGLLLVQAITSWLPATRHTSYLCYQITYPIVAPVQKIIPPIGMIDISLMIVMIALFALNSLGARIFGTLWLLL